MVEELRNDEERIIENMLIDGNNGLYEDLDYLPTRQSLYNSEKMIPEYDDEIFQRITWARPKDINEEACYFDSYSKQLSVLQGSLPDDIFLGTLLAVGVYSKYDLIENIFASKPEDFLKYGIYTCRFYVDGEWVEVITDTYLPCVKDYQSGVLTPVYGRSKLSNEMWISLVEKAFAKAMGSYEAIASLKIQKALLHLTGGSVQFRHLRDDTMYMDSVSDQMAWQEFKRKIDSDAILLLIPNDKKVNEVVNTAESASSGALGGFDNAHGPSAPAERPTTNSIEHNYFNPNRIYSVVLYRELGGYELVLMHNPWNDPNYVWAGEWSDSSNDWDLYPELLFELEKDAAVPWTRRNPNGYFWISYRTMVKHFNKMYVCTLFPHDKYNFYCVKGECRNLTTGGPLSTIRDKEAVLSSAQISKSNSIQKSSAASVLDGDASWFNNPQYRISCAKDTNVYISVIPLGNIEEAQNNNGQNDLEHAAMWVTLCRSSKHTTSSITHHGTEEGGQYHTHLWDVSQFDIEATDKAENGPIYVRGQETSIWSARLDHRYVYHVVPNTSKRGVVGDFIMRVFSSRPISLESVPDLPRIVERGEWRKVGEVDTTGGPPFLLQGEGLYKANPKWCQNPQYHLQIANPYGKEEIYLKIVLRKVEVERGRKQKDQGKHASGSGLQAVDHKKSDATIGLVVTKAHILEENVKNTGSKKPPRMNKLGEPIPPKASSLKKKVDLEVEQAVQYAKQPIKTVLRTLHLDVPSSQHNKQGKESGSPNSKKQETGMLMESNSAKEYQVVTSFTGKNEACVFYPKFPRAFAKHGLIIAPCMGDKGAKAGFELEVYSSEKVTLTSLPEAYTRSLAGEWSEHSAGGSHICGSWKKNPKFILRFHNPVTTEAPVRCRITLARIGANNHWYLMSRKDTVGCMIGFYIFHVKGTEQSQILESTFLPDEEVSTDPTFTLPQLGHGESYLIMPTTFGDGKYGSFVLSILSECEFHLSKDK